METRRSAPLWQLITQAGHMIDGVRGGRSLTPLLQQVALPLRAGTQALSFETLRHLGTATALREQLAPRRPSPALDAVLAVALVLLLPGSSAGYAAFTVVDQAAEAVRRSGQRRAAVAFVNGCLRHFLRDRERLLQMARAKPSGRWNHPHWWLRQLRADFPEHWEQALAIGQYAAPLDLRVHTARIALPDYLARLAREDIVASAVGATAVRLAGSLPVHAIPGHAQGQVSVQSLAAQRAAPMLLHGLGRIPLRILDACAAPGGKTAHLLELVPQAQVLALERSAERADRIHDNLQRLGLRAGVQVADAADVASWWDGQAFDAVLLDAPCSGSGVAGRHPDIRWLRRRGDIARLAAEQTRLLDALWPVLAPGGRMLYCTCSVFRQEGEQRVQEFMADHGDAVRLLAPGHVLPGTAIDAGSAVVHDGFFYALVQKQTH